MDVCREPASRWVGSEALAGVGGGPIMNFNFDSGDEGCVIDGDDTF